jgi:hypothetical protein
VLRLCRSFQKLFEVLSVKNHNRLFWTLPRVRIELAIFRMQIQMCVVQVEFCQVKLAVKPLSEIRKFRELNITEMQTFNVDKKFLQ